MLGFGLGEILVLLAFGVAPVTATSVTAVNPLLGMASSAYFRSPTTLLAGAALMFLTVRSSKPPVSGPAAVIAPPMPPTSGASPAVP